MKTKLLSLFLLLAAVLLFTGGVNSHSGYKPVILDNFQDCTVGSFPRLWKPYKSKGYKIMRVLKRGNNRFARITSIDDGIYIGKRIYHDKYNNLFFKEADGREEGFDLKKNPILSWRWRVHILPKGGNERHSSKNDSGAAVAIIFKKGLFAFSLKYIWSSSLPVGTIIPSPSWFGSYTRFIILRSGKKNLGKWIFEKRNIYKDYKRAFGEVPDRLSKGIAIITDSEATETTAVADYDDIVLYGKRGQ